MQIYLTIVRCVQTNSEVQVAIISKVSKIVLHFEKHKFDFAGETLLLSTFNFIALIMVIVFTLHNCDLLGKRRTLSH